MKPRYIAVDVETTGLRWHSDRLHGFAIAWGPNAEDSRYFSVGPQFRESVDSDGVRAALADPEIEKVGHRVRFDWKFLVQNGFTWRGRTWCTKILQHVLNENEENGLKALALKHLGPTAISNYQALDEAIKAVGGTHVGDLCAADLDGRTPEGAGELIARYCREDAVNTWRLFEILGNKLRELDESVKKTFAVSVGPLDYYCTESIPTEEVLRALEQPGLRLDEAAVRAFGDELRPKGEAADQRFRELLAPEIRPVEEALVAKEVSKLKDPKAIARRQPGIGKCRFNLNSPPQLGRVLYEELKLPPTKTDKGGWSTGYETIQELKDGKLEPRVSEALDQLLAFRDVEKLLGTYVEGFLERQVGGRIYGQYTPWTDTGRLASEDPNMQNIPRGSRIKRAFRPDQDDQVFIYGDYSQVELRIAAHLSQDPVMLDWFQLGIDPHRQAAVSAFGIPEAQVGDKERQAAKQMNFLTIFEGSAWRLNETLVQNGIVGFGLEDCEAMLAGWWKDHPAYRAHLNRILATVRRTRALVAENGRLRRLPDIQYGDWIDARTGRFTGPTEVRYEIERAIAEGKAPSRVYEAPEWKQVFVFCKIKFNHAKKQAYNFPVQSVGASITKAALRELWRQGFTLRTTVHDSIVVQAPREQALELAPKVQAIMESSYKLSVPLKVDLKILNSLDESDLAFPGLLKKVA